MLQRVTQYVIALCDLLEAEGRALRAGSMRLAAALITLLLAAGVVATGLGFLVAGLYLLLAAAINPWAGAMITGGIVLAVGLLTTWIAARVGHS